LSPGAWITKDLIYPSSRMFNIVLFKYYINKLVNYFGCVIYCSSIKVLAMIVFLYFSCSPVFIKCPGKLLVLKDLTFSINQPLIPHHTTTIKVMD